MQGDLGCNLVPSLPPLRDIYVWKHSTHASGDLIVVLALSLPFLDSGGGPHCILWQILKWGSWKRLWWVTLLADFTVTNPLLNVLFIAWPVKSLFYPLSCLVNPKMTSLVMQMFENCGYQA